MELCSIVEGQQYRSKLSETQLSALIKATATPADVHKKKILDCVRGMYFGQDQYAQRFGISVDTQMAKIQGRVLPTPKLICGELSTVVPKDGVWNMRKLKFFDSKSMNHLGFINITKCNDRYIEVFINALTKAGKEMGMSMRQLLFNRPCQMPELESTMKMAKQDFPQLQIILNRKNLILSALMLPMPTTVETRLRHVL